MRSLAHPRRAGRQQSSTGEPHQQDGADDGDEILDQGGRPIATERSGKIGAERSADERADDGADPAGDEAAVIFGLSRSDSIDAGSPGEGDPPIRSSGRSPSSFASRSARSRYVFRPSGPAGWRGECSGIVWRDRSR